MKTKFKISEIEDYSFEHIIASVCGKGEHKFIKAVINVKDNSVVYVVENFRKEIARVQEISKAVEIFNNL